MSVFPDSAATKPSATGPTPSTRQDLPPNNEATLEKAAKDPNVTSNPVFAKRDNPDKVIEGGESAEKK